MTPPRAGITSMWLAGGAMVLVLTGCSGDDPVARTQSIRDTSVTWPGWDKILEVLTLADYNTRIVILGTMLLGLASGVVGTYMLLRKRALVGDAVSHATLPGIAIAFMVMVALGGTGKYLPGLLAGATFTGLLGVGAIMLIRGMTRIKEDAALGIVLSVFFGLGIALLGLIQTMQEGNAAGLESFIYGKTASMIRSDVMLITAAAAVVLAISVLLYKEFAILTFDQEYARAQGWPVLLIDATMMALVIGVSVIGLQAVGLILMIAMLIIPPAAARFWTERLFGMLIIAAVIGAVSGILGATVSALIPRMPAGAIIVIVAAIIFAFSMLFGVRRGVVVRVIETIRLRRTVGRQHLFRTIYEWIEARGLAADARQASIPVAELLPLRSWTAHRLRLGIARARRGGLLTVVDGSVRLTFRGLEEATRIVRNHRLWELFLITHADIAPSHVDRDADQIEHVLGAEMVGELEALLAASPGAVVPPSPHALDVAGERGPT